MIPVNEIADQSYKIRIDYKFHLVFQTVCYIVLAFSSFYPDSVFSSAISGVIIIYFLFSDPREHFFFLIGFAPFEYVASIGGVNSYYIFLIISIVKMVFKNNMPYRLYGLMLFIILVLLEFINEIASVTVGELLMMLTIVVYFCILIMLSEKSYYNLTRILQNICISYFVIVGQMIASYGSFGTFMQMLLTSSDIVRFGDAAVSLGGAMGIPLYSSLVISLIISYYVAKPKLGNKSKILSIIICSAAFLFGFVTISLSFILCMVVCFILLVFSISDKQRKKLLTVLLLLSLSAIVVYLLYDEPINIIIGKFQYRMTQNTGAGIRGEIWESCFQYLRENPRGLLTGFGIMNYVQIGISSGKLFGMMAHNLYIDILMSIGVIGIISLLYFVNILKSKVKNIFDTRFRLVRAIPLFVFLAFGLTALSLNNFKTWIYVVMLIVWAYAIPIEDIQENRK